MHTKFRVKQPNTNGTFRYRRKVLAGNINLLWLTEMLLVITVMDGRMLRMLRNSSDYLATAVRLLVHFTAFFILYL